MVYNKKKSIKVFFFSVPIGKVGVSVGVYSHNGIMTLSLCSDEGRLKDPQEYMRYFEEELREGLKND